MLAVGLLPDTARAQYFDESGLEGLEGIVIEGEKSTTPTPTAPARARSARDIWNKYFYGQAGVSFRTGFNDKAISQRAGFVTLGGKLPINPRITLYAEGRARYLFHEYTAKREDFLDETNRPPVPESRKFTTDDWKFELNSLRAEADLGKYVRVSVGRQPVTWGQMEIFSPVDFILPLRVDSLETLSKVGRRVPQDVAIVSFFPTDWLEISAYGFLTTRIDSFNALTIDRRPPNFRINPADPGGSRRIGKRADSDDHFFEPQFAGRVVFRPGRVTFGLTAYSGKSTLFFLDNRTFQREYPFADGAGGQQLAQDYSSDPRFSDALMFGAELSWPLTSKITFRAEGTWWRIERDLPVTTESLFETPNAQTFPYSFHTRRLQQWIRNNNGNSATIKRNFLVGAAGIDVKLERWRINAYITRPTFTYDGKFKEAVQIEEDRDGDDSIDPFADIPVLPTVNVAWKPFKAREIWLGATGGILSFGAGAGAYVSGESFESLRWVVSGEVIQGFSDAFLTQTNDPNSDYENPEPEFSLRAGLTYSF